MLNDALVKHTKNRRKKKIKLILIKTTFYTFKRRIHLKNKDNSCRVEIHILLLGAT
jgi:hypothetical protein